jgi:hypothetical protein
MLKNLMIIALITALLSFTYIWNKIATLNALIGTLEAGSALLTTKNKRLLSQRNKTKRLVKKHRIGVTKRSLERAAKKMAKAGATMLPFAGMAIVAAAAADDIHDLCTDIQEARDLERELLGETVSSTSQEDAYCQEVIDEELSRIADDVSNRIAEGFNLSQEKLTSRAGEITENIGRFGASYAKVVQVHYDNTVDFWSEQIDSLSC